MTQPARRYTANGITCTVWENEREGRKVESYKIEKRYKDQQGEWKSTDSFQQRDLGALIAVLQAAMHDNVKIHDAYRPAQTAQQSPISNDDVPF